MELFYFYQLIAQKPSRFLYVSLICRRIEKGAKLPARFRTVWRLLIIQWVLVLGRENHRRNDAWFK